MKPCDLVSVNGRPGVIVREADKDHWIVQYKSFSGKIQQENFPKGEVQPRG
jgi:hypothetical protein